MEQIGEMYGRRTYRQFQLGHFPPFQAVLSDCWFPHQLEELSRNSLNQLKSLVMLRKSILTAVGPLNSSGSESTRRTIITLTKHLRVFGKFFRRLQQLAAERFASLPLFNDLVLFYWSEIVDSTNYPHQVISGYYISLVSWSQALTHSNKDSDEVLFPVRFLVQGLVLFKDSLSQWIPIRRSGMPNKNGKFQPLHTHPSLTFPQSFQMSLLRMPFSSLYRDLCLWSPMTLKIGCPTPKIGLISKKRKVTSGSMRLGCVCIQSLPS